MICLMPIPLIFLNSDSPICSGKKDQPSNATPRLTRPSPNGAWRARLSKVSTAHGATKLGLTVKAFQESTRRLKQYAYTDRSPETTVAAMAAFAVGKSMSVWGMYVCYEHRSNFTSIF